MNKKTTLFLLLLYIVAINIFAQSAYSGKDFVVAFGRNNDHQNVLKGTDTVQLILRITALEQAQVTISFTANPSLNDLITVNKGEIRDYKLSYNQATAAYSGGTYLPNNPNMRSIFVSSTGEITLIAVNTAYTSIEATLVMPIENLGTEYFQSGMIPPDMNAHCNGFILIALEDNTTVNFSNLLPTSNNPGACTLKRGEVYHYFKTGNAVYSPLGLNVKTSKPVAYFLNASRIRIKGTSPDDIYSRDNFNFEQMPPVNQWGTKFVVPTVFLQFGSNDEAAIARVYTIERNTKIYVTYSNGQKDSVDINKANFRWQDFRIDSKNHPTARAAYIEANNPISVFLYHVPKKFGAAANAGGMSQPGVAWLPPVEQKISSALVSPLDLNGKHVFMSMWHDFLIITPTATKNNTTISIDGGTPLNLGSRSEFEWVADNVGGSGHSVGRYKFGFSDPLSNIFLKTTAFVENSDGLILLAYGQGSYTNYFYTVGAGARSIDMAFYINGIHYEEVNEKAFCDSIFQINAVSNLLNPQGATYPRWYFNGIEDQSLRGQGITTPFSKKLVLGPHTIKMEYQDADGGSQFRETTFSVINEPTVGTITLQGLCNLSNLNPTPPTVTGSFILSQGWQLETSVESDIYIDIVIPYSVSLSDNDKRIRYYVKTNCGEIYSNAVAITVNPSAKPEITISADVE
jgi:hypothetical protein